MATDLKTIATFTYPYEAEIAKGRLESDGIKAFIQDQHIVQMNWLYSNVVGGIKLMVMQEDLEAAKKILGTDSAGQLGELLGESEKCRECGSHSTSLVRLGRIPTYLSWALLGIPLLFLRFKRICNDCGANWNLGS